MGEIERVGWNWAAVPAGVIHSKTLSPNAKLVYASLLFRAGEKGQCWPKENTLAEDLGVSLSTVQRAIKELEKDNWIRRERRMGSSSMTYIFERQSDCLEFEVTSLHQRSDDHVTGEVTNTSPVKRQNDRKLTREIEQKEKECDLNPSDDLSLPKEERELWKPIEERNVQLSEKVRNAPVQDLRAVQHFNDEEIIKVVAEFHRLFKVPIPSSQKYDKSRVKDWSNGARQIIGVCAGRDPVAMMILFKEWRDKVDPSGDVQFPRPGSLVNMLGAFIGRYDDSGEPPSVLQLDDYGVPIIR